MSFCLYVCVTIVRNCLHINTMNKINALILPSVANTMNTMVN